jgi:Fe-S oxidoreductase/anaerobic glycerol-3-phosphate dehydrogenase
VSARVVVIGGGAAGCAAALAAQAKGSRVTLVSRGAGATALSAGAITLDGLPDESALRARVLGLLRSMAPLAGDGSARTYLSASGAVIRAHLVGTTHAAGALENLEGRKVLVVGLRGLVSTNAADIARRLEMHGAKAEAAVIDAPGLRQRFDLSNFGVAQAMDDPALVAELAASVAREASKSSCDVLALPPVLGLRRAGEARSAMDAALGRPWFELLSPPPSVPGMRLHLAMQERVKSSGIRLITARVVRVDVRETTIVAIHAADEEVDHSIEPDEVVLATGRFIGGGVTCAEPAVETVFGIPVAPSGESGAGTAGMGVETDGEMRPLGPDGGAAFSNVRAAGTVRAGGVYASGTGGIGLAVAQGIAAGEAAAGAGEAAARAAESVARPRGPVRTIEALPLVGHEGCIGCEACASVCPVLGQTSRDGTWYPGPRSLQGLARSGPLLEAAGQPLSLCTMCAACTSICPVGSRNHETFAALRARIIAEHPQGAPAPHLEIPRVLGRSGNIFGAEIEPLPGPRRSDAEIAFFPGCTLPYFERESAEHTVRLLASLGVPLSIVDGVCCGGPLDVLGLEPRTENIEANREAVRATGARVVTAACPRCAHRLARDLRLPGVKVEHTIETLERLLPGSPALDRLRDKVQGRSVTYHDPCELGRYRGLYENARRVLELAGMKLVEMQRSGPSSACCGAGGGLRSVDARLSREIARRRVEEAALTGTGTLLTECPSCLHNLRTGRRRDQPIGVADVSAMLGEALSE